MQGRAALAVFAAFLAAGLSNDCAGQDAAESAIILGGVGPSQGKAQRSLGSAVAGSLGAAANAVGSGPHAGSVRHRRSGHAAEGGYVVPQGGDPLEGTQAPTYKLGNGASIRVSGGLRPARQTTCAKNCPGYGN